MKKKRQTRFLAVLLAICFIITNSPVAAIVQASGLTSGVLNDGSGGLTEGDSETYQKDDEKQEEELEVTLTGLTARHVFLAQDGSAEAYHDVEMEGLEIGSTIRGSDLAGESGAFEFLYSDPEELVLGEEDNFIQLFYEPAQEPADNPDGLERPEEIPAPKLIYPKGLSGGLGLLGGLEDPVVDEHGNIEPPNPGSLALSKNAEAVPGTSNRWRVTLTLTGKNLPTTSDVVLVIDTSGSMGGGSGRMAAAKDAATQFVNTLLDGSNPGTRIAVVSFASSVTTHAGGFRNESGKQALLDAISGLFATGGTFTQAGIRQARLLLADSDAAHKSIVLLSDGEPTYGYRIPAAHNENNWNSDYFVRHSSGWSSEQWYTRDDLAETVFDYGTTVGDGRTMTTGIGSAGPWHATRNYDYNHGHSAIAESRFAKAAGAAVYSVGLTPGTDGQDILNRIADPGKSYEATTENLTAIFQEIAGSIAYAATNATVIDPIGDMFSIPSGLDSEITPSPGTTVSYDSDSETITWTVPFVSEANPASLTYVVEIHSSAQSGVVYPTNGVTEVTYTNALGNSAEKPFEVPKVGVDAGTIVVHYYRVNASGQPVNSQGQPVGTPAAAQLDYFTFREGTNLQLGVPYEVFFSGENASVTTRPIAGILYSYSDAGDDNPTTVELTTSQPSQEVWFACLPAPLELTISDYTGVYDGLSHSIGVSMDTAPGDIVEYSTDGTTWVSTLPTFTDVTDGETVHVKVTNPNYAERRGSGTVEITERPLEITAGSATKPYDGTALTNATWTSGDLAGEDVVDSVIVTGSQTDAGSSPNVASGAVIKRGDDDVTGNYNITYVDGVLEVTLATGAQLNITGYEDEYDSAFHSITVGELEEEGNTIWYNENAEDDESWSTVKPEYMDVGTHTVYVKVTNENYAERRGSGTVKITERPLKITAGSATKPYDGTALTNATWTSGDLAGEDVVDSVIVTGSQTDAGSSPNVASGAVIKRGDDDVTGNYNITYVDGVLEVTLATGAQLNITGYEDEYDSAFHSITVGELEEEGNTIWYSENAEDDESWSTVKPEYMDVGTHTVYVKVTNPNYAERRGSGTVEITERPLEITAGSATKPYDGTALTNATWTSGDLAGEDVVDSVIVTGSQTDAGSSPNVPSGAVIKRGDDDVTGNYNITYVDGVLEVTLATGAQLNITGYEDEYDSAFHSITVGELEEEGNTIWYSENAEDDESWSTVKPEYMDVGTHTVYVKVTNPNYAERRGSGTVKITERPLEITAGSATKPYDGTALTNATWTSGDLAGEDVVDSVIVTGSQTDAGSSPNVASGAVIKRGDDDVTGNYNITYVDGVLEVTLATGAQLNITGYEDEYDSAFHSITVGELEEEGNTIWYSENAEDDESWSTVKPEYMDVGTHTVYVKVTNPNYAERRGSGTVEITERPLEITAGSATKPYDGTALTNATWTSGDLAGEDVVDSVIVTGSQTDAGSSPNVPSAAVIKRGDDDVTGNYNITYVDGVLEVTLATGAQLNITGYEDEYDSAFHSITVGELEEEGNTIWYNENAEDDESWSTVKPEYMDVGTHTVYVKVTNENYAERRGSGTVKITERPLKITAGSATKPYDGTALTNATWTSGDLAGEDVVDSVIVTGSQTDAGSSPNVASGAVIKRGDDDVTGNYNITYVDGVLEVTLATGAQLNITGYEDEYDSAFHSITVGELEEEGNTIWYSENAEDDESWSTVKPEYMDVGTHTVYVKVTNENYAERRGSGTVKITERPLEITAGSATKPYDGTALTNATWTSGDLAGEDVVDSVIVTGSQTDAGSSDNVPSAAVIKRGADDVTGNYNITYVDGVLEVTLATGAQLNITGYEDEYDSAFHSITVGELEEEGNTIWYSENAEDDESWSTVKPEYMDVGTHTVYVKVTNPNYAERRGSGTVKITERPLEITAGSATKPYDGTALTNATWTSGDLAGEDVVDSVIVTGSQTDAGSSPNVASGAVIKRGDDDVTGNYNITYVDGVLEVTLATGAQLNITGYEDEYDSAFHSITVGELKEEGNTIWYNENAEDDESWSTVKPEYMDVGTHTVYVKVTNPNYAERRGSGTVEITERPLEITAGSATKPYDGTALTNATWTSGDLAGEDVVDSVIVTGSQTDAGSSDNVPSAAVIKRGADDVTGNYNITYVDGVLEVTLATGAQLNITGYEDEYDSAFHSITVGELEEEGNTIWYNENAEDDESWSTVKPEYMDVGTHTVYVKVTNPNYAERRGSGTVEITERPLEITAGSATKPYDGTALTNATWTSGDLAGEDVVDSVIVTGSQTDAGSSDNVPSAAVIKRGDDDVTGNYNITYVDGVLEVTLATGAQLNITGYEDEYDSAFHSITVGELKEEGNTIWYNENAEDDESWSTVKPEYMDVGTHTVYVKVTNPNYAERRGSGTVEITERPLEITAGSATKPYDGTALTNATWTSGDLAGEDVVDSVIVTGSQTDAGSSDNVPSAAVIKRGDDDVTGNYNITYVDGVLEVTLATGAQLNITGYEDEYDSAFHSITVGELEEEGNTIWYNENAEDDESWSTVKPEYMDVGTHTVYVKVTNENYAERRGSGTVKITERPLKITAGSATKPYDGTALTNATWTSGDLAGEDVVDSVIVTGSQTDAGSSPNVPSGAVIKRGDDDVTGNYNITYVDGVLEVTLATGAQLNITGYEDEYDSAFHSITVGELEEEGNTIWYSENAEDDESWSTVKPEYMDVGTHTVYVKVTNPNYAERRGSGTVEITERPLEITAGSANKTYDGNPLTSDTYTITDGSVADGDTLVSVTVTGSRTDVGSSPNVASDAVIKRGPAIQQQSDEGGDGWVDVTHNYNIIYLDGILRVSQRPQPPEEPIEPELPPLLNLADHFAYIVGYPDNTVRPEGRITREEVAAVFFRLLDPDYRELVRASESLFPDVLADRWSSKHIATLANGRILEGYPDGTFQPGNFITRAELATVASRFDKLSSLDTNVFPDVEGHWAEEYVNSAAAKGWVEGYPDGTFKPDEYITRAEFVTLVNRVLQRGVHMDDILPEARQFPDLLPESWYYEAMQEAINSHLYERREDGSEEWLEINYPEIEM